MPPSPPFEHYVFVDFENVPAVDLAVVTGKAIHVTLLVGKHQKHLDVSLVRQALRHADQVNLIEVGVSGRNALDLVLAAYLGRASLEHPDAEFTVVSRDRDFDPLITHLQANSVRVERRPDFFARPVRTARPTLAPPAATAGPRVAHRPAKPKAESAAAWPADKLEKLVARLTTGTGSLPRNRSRLLHHLAAYFGHRLPAEQVEAVLQDLVHRGVVTLDAGNSVRYPKRGDSSAVAPSPGGRHAPAAHRPRR